MANEKKDSTAKKSAPPANAKDSANKAVAAQAITDKLAIIAEEDERRAEAAKKLAEIAKLESKAKIKAAIQKMTIKETREVMRFAVALVQSYKAAIADGSITGTDVQFLIMPITLLVPAISGANLIAAEMADLDEAEKVQLAEEFAEVVRNPLYRRLFSAVVEMGDAIIEIVQKSKGGDDDPAVFIADRNLD